HQETAMMSCVRSGLIVIVLCFVLHRGAAQPAAVETAVTPAPRQQSAPALDLRALLERERRAAGEDPSRTGSALLSITATRDGHIEVRNRHGELIEVYDPDDLPLIGLESAEGRQRMEAGRTLIET